MGKGRELVEVEEEQVVGEECVVEENEEEEQKGLRSIGL